MRRHRPPPLPGLPAAALLGGVLFGPACRSSPAVARVVSAGVLPAGAGPEWLDRLAPEERRLRWARTSVPCVSAVLAGAVAVIASRVPDRTVWLCVAVLVLAGVLGAVATDRRLRTVERLVEAAGTTPAARRR